VPGAELFLHRLIVILGQVIVNRLDGVVEKEQETTEVVRGGSGERGHPDESGC